MAQALYELRQQVARLMGEMVTGTPSGSLDVNTFGCPGLAIYDNDYFKDWNGHFYSGTHKDTSFVVTGFVKSGGVVTFVPALGSAVDATDLFELYPPDFKPEDINAAINLAISMVEAEALQDRVDESLIVDNLLTDSDMSIWKSSSVLTYWNTSGAGLLIRDSGMGAGGGLYIARMLNAASNPFALQQDNYLLNYAGKGVSASAHVYCMTAARVRLQLTDGVTTWNSNYHGGTGWEWLNIDGVTLSTIPPTVSVSTRIETGHTLIAYVAQTRLISAEKVYEYPIPAGFYMIEAVTPESSIPTKYNIADRLDPKSWRIMRAPQWVHDPDHPDMRNLWFNRNLVSLTANRKLRLEGQGMPAQLALDASTCSVNPAYIIFQAKALLHQSRIRGTGAEFGEHTTQANLAKANAENERMRLRVAGRGRKVSY